MRPLGLKKKSFWDFIDLYMFKCGQQDHASSGQRAARRNMKRLVRGMKHSEKLLWKKQLKEETDE
jgi:hypothetical protein